MLKQLNYWQYILLFVLLLTNNEINALKPNTSFISKLSNTDEVETCKPFYYFESKPNNYKYFIGGAYSIHETDCTIVKPNSIQEIVAIEWLINNWNQSSTTKNAKIGVFFGDSCGRQKESVLQTLRFLDQANYHNPIDCSLNNHLKNENERRSPSVIGVISPKETESALSVANFLKPLKIPIGVFSSGAAETLLNSGAQNVISTALTLTHYVETFVQVMTVLKSNLVAIIDGGETNSKSLALTAELTKILKENNIFVSEVIGFDHPLVEKIVHETDSKIILSLVEQRKLENKLQFDRSILRMKKIWISMPIETIFHDNNDNENNMKQMSSEFISTTIPFTEIALQQIIIGRDELAFPEFGTYFLSTLKQNYLEFTAFSAYMEQIFNCTTKSKENLNDCKDIFSDKFALLTKFHKQIGNIETILNLINTFALLANKIDETPELKSICDDVLKIEECYEIIIQTVLKIVSTYNNDEPIGIRGQTIAFHRHQHAKTGVNYLIQTNMKLKVIFIERMGRDGLSTYPLIEMHTASPFNRFSINLIPKNLQEIQSICPPYRSYCGRCDHIRKFENDEIFLSNPNQYSLYLAGIFDFHGGPNCEILRGSENIALPLAFSHAVSSYLMQKKREMFNGNTNFSGLEFGAILVDGCSSDRKIMEFLVESENGCYQFMQSATNWTIVSGSTFGYISTSSPTLQNSLTSDIPTVDAWPSVVERFFTTKNSPAPVLTLVDNNANRERYVRARKSTQSIITTNNFFNQQTSINGNSLGSIFSAMPSHRSMAAVILIYLRKMQWDYINIVLDKTDTDSVAIYSEFQKLLSTTPICVAETITFNGESGVTRIAGIDGANVTMLFTGPRAAADYLGQYLRQNNPLSHNNDLENIVENTVHILVGEAVDFYLYDPANIAHFSGAISIQPKDVLEPEFREWLASVTPLSLPESWFWRYVEERWKCALSVRNIDLYQGRMCTGEELLNVAQMGQMTKAGYLAKSTKIFLSAADRIYQKLCVDDYERKTGKICDEYTKQGRLQIRNLLSQTQLEDEFEILEFQAIDHHGNFGYTLIGNYSTRSGFQTIDIYKAYVNGNFISGVQIISRCIAPLCHCAVNNKKKVNEWPFALSASWLNINGNNKEFIMHNGESIQALSIDYWRSDTLKYIFFVLTSVFCVFALSTLVLVVIKMYFRIVKGNQSLGITLLIGILMMYINTYTFILDASETMCGYRVMMHALAHSLCFGVLIVKAVQLKNAEILGAIYSHKISYWNYWLLLIFMFGVQFVICFRWIINPSASLSVFHLATTVNGENIIPVTNDQMNAILLCSNTTPEFFIAEAYSCLLLLFALFLSALNRNIKQNYKEAKWLFVASFSCAMTMTFWIVAQTIVPRIYMDYVTIFQLYLCGSILLLFVFGPKIYVLLSYEPVIVECCGTNGKKDFSTDINCFNKSYDLFEADTKSSRTMSPTLSARTLSPTNSSSVSETSANGMKKRNKENNLSINSLSGSSKQRLVTTLDPTMLSPIIDDNNSSDNEGVRISLKLSSVLQTVLRKKPSSIFGQMHRSQSENDKTVQTMSNSSASTPSKFESNYVASPFLVYSGHNQPQLNYQHHRYQSPAKKLSHKKRSASQKSNK